EAVVRACGRVDVLIVEDDADLARVLVAELEEMGIRTSHARSGTAAIETLTRTAPSLIVLDLVLPGLDGFGVVEWLRTHGGKRDIPLLVYSAREITSAEQKRLTLGPTEFVTKSRVSVQEFEQRVIRLLRAVTTTREPFVPA